MYRGLFTAADNRMCTSCCGPVAKLGNFLSTCNFRDIFPGTPQLQDEYMYTQLSKDAMSAPPLKKYTRTSYIYT